MPDTPQTPPKLKTPRGHRGRAATSEVQYTDAETEFMFAVRTWIKRTGRQFPTCSDYLAIARELGYAKPAPAEGGG